MKKILSIDVGIKNLGLCIWDIDTSSIKYWRVINLCDDLFICSYCNNKSSSFYKEDENIVYVCNKCKKKLSINYDIIPIVKTSTKDFSIIKLGINLKKLLNNKDILGVDKVIIENQIGPLANKMKTIQGMLMQFFIMNNITDIEFISASKKLKYFFPSKSEHIKTYKQRKKIAITLCENIIKRDHNEYVDYFRNNIKNRKL